MENNTILVIDDDKNILAIIEMYLKKEQYNVKTCERGDLALQLFRETQPALVVLDVMLPGLNGLEVLRRIRKESDVPVIMLTARDAVMDKVSGLDAGADDYLTKPFAIEELLARIRVALKRRGVAEVHTHRIEIRGVCMDTDRHEVTVCGEIVELTNREFELLRTLMENKDIVMDREKLLSAVCGYDYLGETNIIDVYVRYLRTKIDDRFGVKLITTVRGVGYVIRE